MFCCECQIPFLCDPRNVWRPEPRCPFRCRQRRKRECGNRRSQKAYQKKENRKAKKVHNCRRQDPNFRRNQASLPDVLIHENTDPDPGICVVDITCHLCVVDASSVEAPSVDTSTTLLPFEFPKVELEYAGVTLQPADIEKSSALSYLRMLLRVIDQVSVSHQELVEILLLSMRQRSMVRRPRRDYVVSFLNSHPP